MDNCDNLSIFWAVKHGDSADVAALCSLGYYSFRLNEDWQIQYPYLKDWFNKLHERESVKSTIPKKLDT